MAYENDHRFQDRASSPNDHVPPRRSGSAIAFIVGGVAVGALVLFFILSGAFGPSAPLNEGPVQGAPGTNAPAAIQQPANPLAPTGTLGATPEPSAPAPAPVE